MIRIVLVTVLAGLVLMACGRGACTTDCAELKLPPSPGAGFDVVVTENDRAVTAHIGQKIELVLHAKSGMSPWTNLTVDDPTVLRGIPTGITAAVGVTVVGFEAIARGTATIRATATPVCSPGQACPQFAMLFEVTVTVT